jgi:hypothetical protein
VGYGARSVNASQTPDWTTVPFIIQTLLPLVAPALFAASIYMILGRIIRFVDAEHLSFIRTTWLTKIFVLGDVLSFLVQCLGKWALMFSITHLLHMSILTAPRWRFTRRSRH